MSTSNGSAHRDTTYVIDAEAALEMARLIQQDLLITQHTGGLFPERPDLSGVHDILDLACGPGGWALQVAQTYPEIRVVGIDISQTVTEYARAQAFVRKIDNVSFRLMDVLAPLDFPDGSFDLVNARLILGFMPPAAWPRLLQECWRVLRPGGTLRLAEAEYGLTNSSASEQLGGMFTKALYLAGQTFSPDGRHISITPMLGRLLRQGGYQRVKHMASAIEFSAGTEAYESTYQDMMLVLKLIQPFLIKWGVTTQEEVEKLYQQALADMLRPDFCGIGYHLMVWGERP